MGGDAQNSQHVFLHLLKEMFLVNLTTILLENV